MKFVAIALSFAMGLALAAPAHAAAPITERTEKVKLQGKKGPRLLRPGFQLGEYEGYYGGVSSTNSMPFFKGSKAKVEIHVTSPSLGEVVVYCGGGESRLGLGWITFKHDRLQYVCTFEGAKAGADAAFAMARSKGTFISRLQQPQRAGELRFGGRTYRLETKAVESGLPLNGGGTIGYIFSRDGVDVGAMDMTGLNFSAYLPAKDSGDRDAAAIAALIVCFLKDDAD